MSKNIQELARDIVAIIRTAETRALATDGDVPPDHMTMSDQELIDFFRTSWALATAVAGDAVEYEDDDDREPCDYLGCGNNQCIFESPLGAGTNGPCSCLHGIEPYRRIRLQKRVMQLRSLEDLVFKAALRAGGAWEYLEARGLKK